MKNILNSVGYLCLIMILFGCDKESTGDEFGIGTGSILSASSTNLALLIGGQGKTVITGGTEPYSVLENTNSSVITVQISSRELQVTALAEGSSSVKVKDSSSPAKTITISVTVKTSYTANVPGSLLFTSTRGNYSANGIAVYGNIPPVSGEGVIAIQDFETLFLLAYKVNSPADIDVTIISFESNTADYSGTFLYPGTLKRVFISYFPHGNPNDSTFLEVGYLLASTATAAIDSISASTMRGTFSGHGYFLTYGTLVTSQTIDVTNGAFNAPIVHTGSMEETTLERNVIRMVRKVVRRNRVF
jgi:hypothetical protein